jgi:hypothetical protein
LPELFCKKAGITDDRHLAIVTVLIVEKTDFTFPTKIGLVQALAFIPPRILTAANIIREDPQ